MSCHRKGSIIFSYVALFNRQEPNRSNISLHLHQVQTILDDTIKHQIHYGLTFCTLGGLVLQCESPFIIYANKGFFSHSGKSSIFQVYVLQEVTIH